MRLRKKIIKFDAHAEIPLKNGYFAIIDLEDVDRASKYGWILDDTKPNWYVHTCSHDTRKTIKLHRFILDAPKGLKVDHINGDGLNNKKSNLRLCSSQQNSANSKKSKRNTSKYKGVHLRENGKSWRACIRVNKKLINLGTFAFEKDAAIEYNKAALVYFGEFARINEL